ncbi:hypothetical protein F5Y13DRAFT_202944 [Hypoxylon sp. FL1857]|nr:hypothetical protein F5Y13DRAFT_202944 [Hypoxylon sp. FL1857]
MLNQVVLVALLPAVLAKPIVQRSQTATMHGAYNGRSILANAAPMAIADGLTEGSTSDAAAEQGKSYNKSVPKMDPRNEAETHTRNNARNPEPTVYISAPEIAGRQVKSSQVSASAEQIAETVVDDAASMENGIDDAVDTSMADIPYPKRENAAPSNGTASKGQGTSTSCDCIGACSGQDGKASQMKCMKACAKSCDGDDDTKKKNDPLGGLLSGSLLSGLGMRDVEPRDYPHQSSPPRYEQKKPDPAPHYKEKPQPQPKPEHVVVGGAEEEEYESCMKKCKTHNCQHSSVGLDIDQCGNTSCEESCARYKKGEKFESEHLVYSPHPKREASYPKKNPQPAVPGYVEVEGHMDFENCMKKCSSHNCQHSSVGIDIDQCGNTSCEDSCAKYKKSNKNAKSGKIPSQIHGREQHSPAAYPAKQAPKPYPKKDPAPRPLVHGKLQGNEEYESCMKSCKTHNCQHSSVGIDIDQCGNTSCDEKCKKYKKEEHAEFSTVRAREEQRKTEPAVQKKPAYYPGKPESVVKSANEEYESCMHKCKTHNCQHSSVGIDIDQCGSTSCEDECVRYKKAEHEGHSKRQFEPVAEAAAVPAVPNVPNVPNMPNVPEVPNVPNTPNVPQVPAVPNMPNVPDVPAVPNAPNMPNVPEVPAVPNAPNMPNVPDAPAVPNVPYTPYAPAAPAAPAAPNAPPAPYSPATPYAPYAPFAPYGPHAPHVPHPRNANTPPGVIYGGKTPVSEASGMTDFESCMSKCKTRQCKHANIGHGISQCGDTSCEDSCAQFKEGNHAEVDKVRVKVPGGRLIANPVAGPKTLVVPNVQEVPVADAGESKEFQNCMHKCKTHNCQDAGLGVDVSQCGNTSCDEKCAKFKEGKEAHAVGTPHPAPLPITYPHHYGGKISI